METPRRKALGKGLEELFNTEVYSMDSLEKQILDETPKDAIISINIDELRSNPYQPRKIFDEKALEELAESIKLHGVFQPIIVKKSIKGYEIVAGERRVKASKLAGLDTIPAIVREFDDEKMMEIALLENLQRENLNAIEEAQAYVKIMETKNLTHDALAEIVGKSQSYIANTIGLLHLPEEVKDMLVNNQLSMTHARILSKLKDKDVIIELANKVVNDSLSVRDLEEIAKNGEIQKRVKVVRVPKESELEYKYIENNLCDRLGTKVRVYKNKMEIKYANINDLNRILEILNIGK